MDLLSVSAGTIQIQEQSAERVFPDCWPKTTGQTENASASPECTLLSIVDAAVARWTTSGATWFLDPTTPDEAHGCHSFDSQVKHLRRALTQTLDAYPQWCGQLRPAPYQPERGHAHRFRCGRIELAVHGDASPSTQDPGVGFIVAQCDAPLASLLPATETLGGSEEAGKFAARDGRDDFWNRFILNNSFTLKQPMHDGADAKDPGAIVQVTSFKCGGLAVTVQIAHALADAHALTHFVKDWATVSRGLLATEQGSSRGIMSAIRPIFDPQVLDRAAAGDINAGAPDNSIIQHARSLPVNRFDWWASRSTCPFPAETGKIPRELESDPAAHEPAGNLMNWNDWNVFAPVSHYILHYRQDQIQKIWEQASTGQPEAVSRNDAMLAHIWSCVNRARGLQQDDDYVHCDLTYGLRPRTIPPLGDGFLGSPIMIADVKMKGRDVCGDSPARIAAHIKSTLNKFDATAIGAQLHSIAFDHTPQRIWAAFVGKRHILVTSWVHAGLFKVDFGLGQNIRHVRPVMPPIDGCIQFTEGTPATSFQQEQRAGQGAPRRWDHAGLDISVHLECEAMSRLLADPLLWP